MKFGQGTIQRVVVLGAVAFAASATTDAQEVTVLHKAVQLHGFGTQGLSYTNDNNWLTMNTSEGSLKFTDMGLNVSSQVTSKFRVGAQVYSRELGQLGRWHPRLDWAIADLRLEPWLGFRGGKVKTVFGLYTDTQDMDFANTFALLPQSVYPIDLRDATIAHLGGDIYGTVRLPHLSGSVAYTAYGGRRSDSMHSGYPYLLTTYGIFLKSYGGPVYGGDLRWKAPLRGLTLGVSRLNERITGKGSYNGAVGIPATPHYFEYSKHDWANQFYGRFVRQKFHVESEYRRSYRDQVIFNELTWVETDVRGWYVGGGYQTNRWLELGAYYSDYRIFADAGLGISEGYPDPTKHDYDKVATAKFSLSQYATVKIEGHFMQGNGSELYPDGFYSGADATGLKDNTIALVVRTGFSF